MASSMACSARLRACALVCGNKSKIDMDRQGYCRGLDELTDCFQGDAERLTKKLMALARDCAVPTESGALSGRSTRLQDLFAARRSSVDPAERKKLRR